MPILKKTDVKKTKKLLINVEPEKSFWVCNGEIFKNLKELVDGLERMTEEVFNYHVTKEKNDFVNWIKDVFKDEKLACDLKKAKTPKTAAKKNKDKN